MNAQLQRCWIQHIQQTFQPQGILPSGFPFQKLANIKQKQFISLTPASCSQSLHAPTASCSSFNWKKKIWLKSWKTWFVSPSPLTFVYRITILQEDSWLFPSLNCGRPGKGLWPHPPSSDKCTQNRHRFRSGRVDDLIINILWCLKTP